MTKAIIIALLGTFLIVTACCLYLTYTTIVRWFKWATSSKVQQSSRL